MADDWSRIRELDARVVRAARDIKVLSAIAWPASSVEEFLAGWQAGNPRVPVVELTYDFLPLDTLTATNVIVFNFPLTITGTDRNSGDFEYTYANSTQTLTPVPEPATMLLLGTGLGALAYRRRR